MWHRPIRLQDLPAMLLCQWLLCIITVLVPIRWARHILCAVLLCHTLSLRCPFPAMSQLSIPLSPCLWHPYVLPSYSFSFSSRQLLSYQVFSDLSEVKQKWHKQQKKPQAGVWLCPAFLMHLVHWCLPVPEALQHGPSATSQASEKLSHWSGMEMHEAWRCMMLCWPWSERRNRRLIGQD